MYLTVACNGRHRTRKSVVRGFVACQGLLWVTDAIVFAISTTIESVPAVPVSGVDGVLLLVHYLGVFEGRYWCRVALCEKGQESRIKSEAQMRRAPPWLGCSPGLCAPSPWR
jgi:hypothetical protein